MRMGASVAAARVAAALRNCLKGRLAYAEKVDCDCYCAGCCDLGRLGIWGREYLKIDSCLDQGGRWNYDQSICEMK